MEAETQKQAKKEKPSLAKKPTMVPEQLKALIEAGIPIRKAVFHRTVQFENGTPESAFYDANYSPGTKQWRIARMWYTPHGVICENKGEYKIVPLPNVSDTVV